jgi:hypothetical protein
MSTVPGERGRAEQQWTPSPRRGEGGSEEIRSAMRVHEYKRQDFKSEVPSRQSNRCGANPLAPFARPKTRWPEVQEAGADRPLRGRFLLRGRASHYRNRWRAACHGGRNDRTRILEAMGYLVLRFWNNEVHENIDGVLETILNVLDRSEPPHPDPLPSGEREKRRRVR